MSKGNTKHGDSMFAALCALALVIALMWAVI